MMQEKNSENDMDARIGNRYFIIKGNYYGDKCFPGLNDLIHQAERNPKAYNKIKRDFERIAINAIRKFLNGWKAECKVVLHYTFGEPIKGPKRDYDNIVSAGRKIINDALVKTTTIVDDNPRFLGYGTNEFVYVETPFIKVEITEVGYEN